MSLARAMPYLILVLLVGGISAAFLYFDQGQPTQPPPAVTTDGGTLVRLGPVLRGFVNSGDPQLDASILVRAALDNGPEDARAPILEALRQEDWGSRWAGAIAVERYGGSDEPLQGALLPLLEEEQALVRASAARAAAFLRDPEFEALLPSLTALFRDVDALVREAALAAVGRRAARYPYLIPSFARALGDEEHGCRVQGARALAQIELQERVRPEVMGRVRGALVKALADPRNEVRIYAIMALGRAGPAAGPDVPALIPLLGDADPLVRGQAATALGSIGPAALPALTAALAEESGPGAPSLLWALRLMGAPALPLLRETLAHPHAMVRMLVAQQLWEVEENIPGAVAVLRAGLQEEDRAVRLVAIRVLGRMGTEGAVALPVLEQLALDEEPAVAQAAAAAVERLKSVEKKR